MTSKEHPRLPDPQTLHLDIKSVYETMALDRIVTSLLISAVLSSSYWPPTNLLNQKNKFNTMNTTRAEMERIVAEKRVKSSNIQIATSHRIPHTTRL